MMRLGLVSGLVLAVVLVVPVASAGADFTSVRAIASAGSTLDADAGVLAWRPGDAAAALIQGSIGAGTGVLVTEWNEGSIKSPTNPEGQETVVGGEENRAEDEFEIQSGMLTVGAVLDDDAILIVVPAAGASIHMATESQLDVTSAPGEQLEQAHATAGDEVGVGSPSPFVFYEYIVPPGLKAVPEGDATIEVQGDFEVYLWGFQFTVSTTDGQESFDTGFESRASQGGPVDTVRDDYFRYAKVNVRDGTFYLDSVAGASLYFQDGSAQAERVRFEAVDGVVPGTNGRFEASNGGVDAVGGTYDLVYDGGRMGVDVTEMPTQVEGTTGVYTPKSPTGPSVLGLLLFGVLGIVTVSAGVYSVPTVRGTLHNRRMEHLTGEPRTRGWRASRAEGYALMAAAAEDGGHVRRAALWMGLACRFDPHDPHKTMDRAIFLAALGRHGAALRLHEKAHRGLEELGEVDDMAHNAYEAARCAALIQRTASALDWLRIAAQVNPSHATRAAHDPAFAPVRGEADYASLVVPATV